MGKLRCDASTWTKERLSKDSHITTGKHSARSVERLQRALWSQPPIRRHMCKLSVALEYDTSCLGDMSTQASKGWCGVRVWAFKTFGRCLPFQVAAQLSSG